MIKRLLSSIVSRELFKRDNRHLLEAEWMTSTPIVNEPPLQKIERICFVIPAFSAYGGGITSILRLGTYLFKSGYNITYASYSDRSNIQELIDAAKLCYADYKGKIVHLNNISDKEEFDVIIATNVISVYYACRLTGYKMTFVQDYEPLFDPAGDWHYLARKSYELGFHMVSLGEWNKYMIQKNIDNSLKIDTVTFPYEKSEYQYIQRDFESYKNKEIIKMCVYMRETPRRLPGICQIISEKLSERFESDGKKLEVYYFGSSNKVFQGGVVLGQLNKQQLNKLYQECDFGMVFSYTNISLIPFEMMATGLPIIELKEGSFPFFFTNSAFLFHLNYDELYDEITTAIKNPQILRNRDEQIQNKMKDLSWEATAKEFENILLGIAGLNKS